MRAFAPALAADDENRRAPDSIVWVITACLAMFSRCRSGDMLARGFAFPLK